MELGCSFSVHQKNFNSLFSDLFQCTSNQHGCNNFFNMVINCFLNIFAIKKEFRGRLEDFCMENLQNPHASISARAGLNMDRF
jgi:hypothetical protein